MFCTSCFGHPKDCNCGVLQPKADFKGSSYQYDQPKCECACPVKTPEYTPMVRHQRYRTINGKSVPVERIGGNWRPSDMANRLNGDHRTIVKGNPK